MPHLDNGAFLKQLKTLFDNSQTTGAVYVSFKGVIVDETKKAKKSEKKPTDPKKPGEGEKKPTLDKKAAAEKKQAAVEKKMATGEYRCLVRATNGKSTRNKVKISTHVRTKDLVSFQLAYNKILTSSMDSLKKREKKKKKKKAKHA